MEYTTTLATHEPIAITIGNFDGIHRGHQRLLHELCAMAQELHCTPVVVTFSPHTLLVVRPDIYVEYLTTLEEKLTLVKEYGAISNSIVIHFTPQVASMSAKDFMDHLGTRFAIRGMVVGTNFSLGHKRMGDVAFLQQYGQEHQFQVRTVLLEEAEQARISSTRIRTLVKEGSISEANDLLGHPVRIDGTILHGDERGRLLGFPTANMLPDPHKLLPADGVYAVYARIHNGQERDLPTGSTVYKGVANIGVRPTFNGKERLIEVHLLDVNLDLYGKHLILDFIAHLRNEQRFSGIDALKTQISIDVQKARQILAIGG